MDIQPDFTETGDPTETGGAAPEASTEGAPDAATETPSSETPDAANTPAEMLELDKHERFKLDGKEWTRKDLTASIMLQSDYTRKTQEIAREREFNANLNADLEKVRGNPALEEQFRRIYPEGYHKFLDYVRTAKPPGAAPNEKAEPNPLEEKLKALESRISSYDEERVEGLVAKLEAQDQQFGTKYPMADIEAVHARARAEHSKGTKLTAEKWDELWKADHAKHDARYKKIYSKQVQTQKEASRQARDIGGGGGTPGQAPKTTLLKDVGKQVLAEMGVE